MASYKGVLPGGCQYVDRILRGQAGRSAVQQPEKFELLLNLKPQGDRPHVPRILLAPRDEVIE